MISITRLLELKTDIARYHQYKYAVYSSSNPVEQGHRDAEYIAARNQIGGYLDILEDYLRLHQGSA